MVVLNIGAIIISLGFDCDVTIWFEKLLDEGFFQERPSFVITLEKFLALNGRYPTFIFSPVSVSRELSNRSAVSEFPVVLNSSRVSIPLLVYSSYEILLECLFSQWLRFVDHL